MVIKTKMAGDEVEGEARPLGDTEFKRALTEVAPHLRAFARGLCGCRDRADDLAQETLLRAWAARDRYRAGTNFKAWTFTILRNHFYSEARRARFHGDYDEAMAERTLRAPASQESAVELSDVLRALSLVPETYREALILVAIGSLSSGKLPDFRHNFVLTGTAVDAFFAELARIANPETAEPVAA
jgi:RNA polymerase sigma-70 factor (ECF subfamily)